jgi:DNA-binding transcriptional ArsR family regulator
VTTTGTEERRFADSGETLAPAAEESLTENADEASASEQQPLGCASPPPLPLDIDRDEAERIAELFKVLGDPTRVLILQALVTQGELCVHQLAEAVAMSQSSVSHHLRLLRTSGLIRARRRGREVHYRPDDDHVEQLIGVCAEHIGHGQGAGSTVAGTSSDAGTVRGNGGRHG